MAAAKAASRSFSVLRLTTLTLTAFVILVGAVLPGQYSPLALLVDDLLPELDHQSALTIAHIFGFGIAVPIASWALRSAVYGASSVLFFSCAVEVIQVYLPHRSGDWIDVGWNALAVGLGSFLSLVLRPHMQR